MIGRRRGTMLIGRLVREIEAWNGFSLGAVRCVFDDGTLADPSITLTEFRKLEGRAPHALVPGGGRDHHPSICKICGGTKSVLPHEVYRRLEILDGQTERRKAVFRETRRRA